MSVTLGCISSMQKGGFGLNGAHFPKFGHFGSQILAHGFPKYNSWAKMLLTKWPNFDKWTSFKPKLPFCIR